MLYILTTHLVYVRRIYLTGPRPWKCVRRCSVRAETVSITVMWRVGTIAPAGSVVDDRVEWDGGWGGGMSVC